jgi:hypothetical protein
MRRVAVLWVIFISLSFLTLGGCGSGSARGSGSPNSVVARGNTYIVPTDGSVTVASSDVTHAVLTGNVPALSSGQIIAAGNPTPVFGKIDTIDTTTAGETRVTLSSASLDEAFEEIHASASMPVTEASVSSLTPAPNVTATWVSRSAQTTKSRDGGPKGSLELKLPAQRIYDGDNNPATKRDNLMCVPTVTVSLTAFFSAENIRPLSGGTKKIEAGLGLDGDVDLKFYREEDDPDSLSLPTFEKTIEFPLGHLNIKPFWIEGTPIVVYPSLDASIPIRVKVDADLNPHVVIHFQSRFGGGVSGDSAYPIHEFHVGEPIFETGIGRVSCSAEILLPKTRLTLKLWNIAGPYVEAGPYFKADINAILLPPTMHLTLSAGLQGSVGFAGNLFGLSTDKTATLDFEAWKTEYTKNIASGSDVTVRSAPVNRAGGAINRMKTGLVATGGTN